MADEQIDVGMMQSSESGQNGGNSGAPAAPAPAMPDEKLIPQSRVNELVGQTRTRAREEGYSRALQELQAKESAAAPISQQEAPKGATKDEIRQWLNEFEEEKNQKREQAAIEADAHQMIGNFYSNLKGAQERYPDFEQKVGQFNLSSPIIVSLLPYLHDMPNAGDIMYEFATNPRKMVDIAAISQVSPELTKENLRKLAESITQNQTAKNTYSPSMPDMPLNPSKKGVDNGEPSISELRMQKWLKV